MPLFTCQVKTWRRYLEAVISSKSFPSTHWKEWSMETLSLGDHRVGPPVQSFSNLGRRLEERHQQLRCKFLCLYPPKQPPPEPQIPLHWFSMTPYGDQWGPIPILGFGNIRNHWYFQVQYTWSPKTLFFSPHTSSMHFRTFVEIIFFDLCNPPRCHGHNLVLVLITANHRWATACVALLFS